FGLEEFGDDLGDGTFDDRAMAFEVEIDRARNGNLAQFRLGLNPFVDDEFERFAVRGEQSLCVVVDGNVGGGQVEGGDGAVGDLRGDLFGALRGFGEIGTFLAFASVAAV